MNDATHLVDGGHTIDGQPTDVTVERPPELRADVRARRARRGAPAGAPAPAEEE